MTISRNLSIFAANVTSTGTYSQFDTGTLMLFQQTTAPTGWTKQTTHHDKALRVVTGSVSFGGVVPHSAVFANTTPTAGATTISTTQMPAHTHAYQAGGGTLYGQGLGSPQEGYQTAISGSGGASTTGSQGGGSSHTHSVSSITLAVQYVDLIIASKT
jgi:hypothetical protein